MHVWSLIILDVGAWFILDCLPYEWQSGTSDGLFLPIYPPRGMHSSTLLWGIIKFCNKYMSSLWLMWVHGLYALLPFCVLLASSVPCIAHSHLELWCKLRRCIQTPWYDTLYHTYDLLYLPQNSHHTYVLWPFHSHSEIYCHATFHRSVHMTHITFVILLFAWTCSWHCICGKAIFIIFIHVALDSLNIPVHRQRHSYRVISCSKYRVVIIEL